MYNSPEHGSDHHSCCQRRGIMRNVTVHGSGTYVFRLDATKSVRPFKVSGHTWHCSVKVFVFFVGI